MKKYKNFEDELDAIRKKLKKEESLKDNEPDK